MRNIILIVDDSEYKKNYLVENIERYLEEYQKDSQLEIVSMDNLHELLNFCISKKNDILCIFLDLCFYRYKDHFGGLYSSAGYQFLIESKTHRFSFLKDIPVILSSSEYVVDDKYKKFENITDCIIVDTSLYIYRDIERALTNIFNKENIKKTNISGIYNDYLKMYNEMKAWNSIEESDSKLKGVLYGIGYAMYELPYHNKDKETMNKENQIYKTIQTAYDNLLNALRDALGIESSELENILSKMGDVLDKKIEHGFDSTLKTMSNELNKETNNND